MRSRVASKLVPRHRSAVVLPFVVVFGVACTSSTPGDPSTPIVRDAGEDLPSSFELTIGTGRDRFEELDAEGTLVLERGTQGLQHVYVSLRAPVTEGLHPVELSIFEGEHVLSAPTRLSVPFVAMEGSVTAEMVGQLVVVPDPSGFTEGRPATLRARVDSRADGVGTTERVVRLRW